MITRFIATAALALSLLATAASAQTATELFQKGLYAQQTAGDADGAISIYRQIIASAGTPRPLAAQAQMQIVGALLQKGDVNAASEEFRTLLTNYSDQKALIASVAARFGGAIRMAAQAPTGPPKLTLGTLENGVYHHTTTGTEITLPPGWKVVGDGMSTGDGEMVLFSMGGSTVNSANASLWLKLETPALDIPHQLEADILEKVKERVIDGFSGYKVRPETVNPWLPNGQQALSAVAQFTDRDGKPFVEHLTYIRNEKVFAFVFFRGPEPGVLGYQDEVDQLTKGIKLP
jgi:hypothetical protein